MSGESFARQSSNFDDRVAATARMLEAACRESAFNITGDGRIGESSAAVLLGLAEATLANKRAEGSGPAFFRIGGHGHRVSYRLSDVAAWIEANRCDRSL